MGASHRTLLVALNPVDCLELGMPTATPPTKDTTQTPGPNPGAAKVVRTRAEQQQHDREVYRRLTGADAGEPAAREPAANGQGATASPAATKPTTPPGEPSSTGKPAPAAPPKLDDAQRRELVETAKAVLTRDGLSPKAQAALIASLDPAELETEIAHRRKVQRDTDQLGTTKAQLERQLKERAPGADPKGDKPSPEDLSDLTPKQRAQVEKIRGEGDEDRAKELVEAFRDGKPAGTTRGAEPARSQEDPNANSEAQIAAKEASLLVTLRSPLDGLKGKFPKLADNAERLEVIRVADRMVRAGVFGESGSVPITDILTKAAGVRYGDETDTAAQARLLERNQQERHGQPDSSTTVAAPKTPLTGKARDREAWRLLNDGTGKTPEQVARILSERT